MQVAMSAAEQLKIHLGMVSTYVFEARKQNYMHIISHSEVHH